MNEDDAIRDLVRAIKGNDAANEALDRLVDHIRRGGYGQDSGRLAMRERVATERAAA